MAEIALINFDKCEIVDPTETGHGFKMTEAIANWMSADILWMFAVPADNQPVPPASTNPSAEFRRVVSPRVAIGHWAGDRVLIVDEYCGSAADNLPADVLAKFPDADPQDDVLEYVQTNWKHVGLADYTPAEKIDLKDVLFPGDRVWVVRNLTKRWYARSDVLVKPKHARGPTITGGLGLGDLIWAEIGGGMSTGSSHCDRFDVQTLESIGDGKGWTDKSKQAKSTLREFDMNDDVSQYRGVDYDEIEDEDY
ncbi:F-box domain containing protein [Mycena venus]|uniref:F-box domain containing protein n=1 Tax=Mycena venus TaxID=2733690 RepID=A0A8H6Y108_9AGAR|nr:F-box domain containing protein [Mycena venus]